jgi:hypothetical protein
LPHFVCFLASHILLFLTIPKYTIMIEITSIQLSSFKEKFKSLIKNVFSIALIIASMSIGFIASQLYHRYKESTKVDIQEIQTSKQIFTAFGEKGELLLINRKTGAYNMYSDEIVKIIFNHQASVMYNTSKEKSK